MKQEYLIKFTRKRCIVVYLVIVSFIATILGILNDPNLIKQFQNVSVYDFIITFAFLYIWMFAEMVGFNIYVILLFFIVRIFVRRNIKKESKIK